MPLDSWTLEQNPAWPPCAAEVPLVTVRTELVGASLRIRWNVQESPLTYRCEVRADGGPCWQDSCVEAFIHCLDGSGNYCNFEFNSMGFCLAARGPDRHFRHPLPQSELERIERIPAPPDPTQLHQPQLHWSLEVELPLAVLGWHEHSAHLPQVMGNFQKCGDQAQAPHWLTAFPIASPRPDFHRPEFFSRIA